MTIKELSQLYYLNREIERDRERLSILRSMASSMGASGFDGIPKSGSLGGRLEQCIAEIVDLEVIIQAKITQCLHERNRLERYISDIPDSITRQVFQLRFVSGLPWAQIALSIGGGNTEEGVRKRVYRYIKQKNLEDGQCCPKMSGLPMV